jgi:glycosyltransferase involved in cell wall biosynthesis
VRRPGSPVRQPRDSLMEQLTLALDVGPLYGHRTGVAVATDHLLAGLISRPEVTVVPYLLSARSRPRPGDIRLPLPAAAAIRLWSHLDHPRVDRWLRGAQVLHGTNYIAPPSRIPRVISVYDCWFLLHPESASPAVNRAAQVLRRAVASGAHIHVSSTATAAVASELLQTDQITVVHLGPPTPPTSTEVADLAEDRLGTYGIDPTRSRLILAIGTVERRKDLGSLVEAFGLIAGDHRDAHLVLAGAQGDDQSKVEIAIATLPGPLQQRVHLLGPIDQATKTQLLAAAQILAYPSIDEGFGFPILEAQQVGLAVVARPAGSIPEVGGAGIHLAQDHTVAALADALNNVLSDDHHRSSLIAAGYENLRRFSWSRCVDEMLTLYRNLGAQ